MGKIIRLNNIGKHVKPFTATLTGGGFDLFHIGHLKFLKKCSDLGRPLVVVVQTDKTIKLRKGFNRPIIPQQERAQIVSYLAIVDFILILDKPFYHPKYINLIKPKILAFAGENLKFRKEILRLIQIKHQKIEGVFIPKQSKKTSTSTLIKKISTGYKQPPIDNPLIKELISESTNSNSNLGKTAAIIKRNGKTIVKACNVAEKHAEELAINKAHHLRVPLKECEIYSLLNPCLLCARLIVKNKMKAVFYVYDYGLDDSKKLFKKNNIMIQRFS